MLDSKLYKGLRKSLIFRDASDSNFEEIIREISFRIVDFKKNEILFFEGDDCSSIGIVLDGEVNVNKGVTIGKKVNITKIKPGDMFAEALVFSENHRFPATIEAALDSKVLFISRENIIKMCSKYPGLIERFMGILSTKISMLNNKVSLLSMKSIRQKILFYMTKESKRDKNGCVSIKITKQELAQRIGVERPSLSRELLKMQEERLIIMDGKKISVICDISEYLL